MRINLDDLGKWEEFAPLTLTRPVGNLRMGGLTNDERCKLLVPGIEVGYRTKSYLSGLFPELNDAISLAGWVIPTAELMNAVLELRPDTRIVYEGQTIAIRGNGDRTEAFEGELLVLNKRWELYQKNAQALQADFDLITNGRQSQEISATNTIIDSGNALFLEEGASVEGCILNATNGPIYVGKDAEIMEGSIVRGGLFMAEGSVLKLGTKIYGPTTLGPHCKVGGELNNCIFYGYSNKGHDGFLGNTLVGEWCNLGADTNTSNLKNNYGKVKTYSYTTGQFEQTDVQFMGLVMGDHSKCGINTMFNTATVVGVSANVFGAEFPPKKIRSFTWGMGEEQFDFAKALESMNNMMIRRNRQLSDQEINVLKYLSDRE